MGQERGVADPLSTTLDRIKLATIYKELGNEQYKLQSYTSALFAYNRMEFILKSVGQSLGGTLGLVAEQGQADVTEEEELEVKALQYAQCANRAQIYLIKKKWEKAEQAATKALTYKETERAYFRRGQAWMNMQNVEKAIEDFEKALSLSPGDKAIASQLEKAKARDAADRKKSDAKLRGFLSR